MRPLATRAPNPEAFRKFLSWLHPDAEAAAERYTALHRRLVKVFSCNACHGPEDLADETLDRIIGKIDSVAGIPVAERPLYVFGVARNVKRAYYGSTERAVRRWAPLPEPSEELFDKERQDACLQECLRTLDPEDRRLLTAYYQDEKRKKIDRRRELAEEERLTAAALRKKIQRLRDRLLDCLQRCYNRTRDEPQP